MKNFLKKYEIEILDIFYCPHHPTEGTKEYRKKCSCRKPESGMLEKAIEKYDVDIENSFMIGDKESDLKAGEKIGIKPILVLTGYGKKTRENTDNKYMYGDNLLEIAKLIKKIKS